MAKKKITAISNDYILLDRSGSMATRWDEALSSVNAYVDELQKKKADGTITLITFDEHGGIMFDVIRDSVKIKDYKPVTSAECTPRGGTPLFDAVGKTIAKAEGANQEKTVIVVMTDGEENASREFNKASAQAAVKRCHDRGWQVLFLGADFNSAQQASSVGVTMDCNMTVTTGNYAAGLRSVANSRTLYASGASANMSFSAEDRAKQKS